ncbi:MAG: hypothetical protein FJY19_04065 [Bacteroidetes bacterium]|nr:hypothetical protein [Bacteroidota bacterium]
MKKSILFTLALFIAFSGWAQNYDPVKTLVMINQLDKAKTDLDKAFTNAKYTSKPEAFILKTVVYASVANMDGKKDTPAAAQLIEEADAAFTKYRELDPALSLISEPIYQNGIIMLYSNYYSFGYSEYTNKTYEKALDKLKKAIHYSDLLIKQKVLTSSLDTNVLILAAITAETGGFKDDAAAYYTKLADAKVGGDGYEGVYRYLVTYHFGKKKMDSFEKYKMLGKEVFPKSDYFDFDKVDFAVGLAGTFTEKIVAIEEVLATDPANFKANQVLGEIIYDTLNPRDEEAVVLPENYLELEKKMIDAFTRSSKSRPDYEIPSIYVGDHYINKAGRVEEKRNTHAREMKARTKPGTMASKEDVAKRDALDREYGETMELAKDPYLAAATIFANRAAEKDLETRDKQQYKKVASYLSEIYGLKKIAANKAKNFADKAKWEAEEKKWNERYESIKN